MVKTTLKNTKSYIEEIKKEFRNFKLIEIINEFEVKEHLTFVHPFYGIGGSSKYQRLYISDNMKHMIERLDNQRVIFYKREMIRWKMVRRIQGWPMDMSELSYSNYLCSPDLMYYLDYDRNID